MKRLHLFVICVLITLFGMHTNLLGQTALLKLNLENEPRFEQEKQKEKKYTIAGGIYSFTHTESSFDVLLNLDGDDEYDINNLEDIALLCYTILDHEFERNVSDEVSMPKVISVLSQWEGINIQHENKVRKSIGEIWKKYYGKITCNDLNGEVDFPTGGMLRTAVVANSLLFYNACINEYCKNYNIDINLINPHDGNTILTWLREKRKKCDERWCNRLMSQLDNWERRLVNAGAKTNEEVDLAKEKKKENASKIMYKTFVDKRDGKAYKFVELGYQEWMAENLNYNSEGSYCYDYNEDNCEEYGRLYTWEKATTVCPSGWHLPNNEEWDRLINYCGGIENVAEKLISSKGWGWRHDYSFTESNGFDALPGGFWHIKYFSSIADGRGRNYKAAWWSKTHEAEKYAWYYQLGMTWDNSGELDYWVSKKKAEGSYETYEIMKTFKLSVRCIKD